MKTREAKMYGKRGFRLPPEIGMTLSSFSHWEPKALGVLWINNPTVPHNVSTVDISHTFFLHFNSHRLTPPFCICKPVLPTGRLVAPYPDATKNARRRIQRAQSFSQFARSGQRRRRVISPKGDVTPVKMQCKYNHDSLITDVLLTEINKTVLI